MNEADSPDRGDMDPDEFRRFGHLLVDWVADYLSDPGRYPVLSRSKPGEIRRLLPDQPPEEGEPMEAILSDLEAVILPGITHWNHPSFFSYFSITGSGPGILGELLCAALNVNGMLWRTSPAATELEEVVVAWLRRMLGLPESNWGIIYDTASISTLHALAAAREVVPGLDCRRKGLARGTQPLRVYTSEEAHSSIDKAALALGLGQVGVHRVEVDDRFRMKPEALGMAIERDLLAGMRPFCVVATVGTTSTTSVDPVRPIAELCRRYGLWLHVDAAYAGPAAILPEMRWILEGCEDADSLVTNPHKWLFTPIDCSVLFCRRPEVLREAFSLVPEYLRSGEQATNFMDYGVQLGRRFRALKLWMVIRYFGRKGIEARIRRHIEWARQLSSWIDADPGFERMAPTPFSAVCFRALPADPPGRDGTAADRFNEELLERVNQSGEAFLSHTRLRGRFALRLAIGNLKTTEDHVRRVWDLVRESAASMRTSGVRNEE
jgi:aromatic-L-amino-acid/L-tryptophan decarboxylase